MEVFSTLRYVRIPPETVLFPVLPSTLGLKSDFHLSLGVLPELALSLRQPTPKVCLGNRGTLPTESPGLLPQSL